MIPPAQVSAVCIQPPEGQVNWWPGDGNANDIIGGKHGTLQNGATFAPGEVGQAFSFDGVDDYVNIPAPDFTTNTITFTAWVNGVPVTGFSGIMYSRNDPQPVGMGYGGGTTAGKLSYTWNNDNPSTYNWDSGLIIPQNQWAFVAVTIDSNKAVAYLCSSSGCNSATNSIAHISQTLNGNFRIGSDAVASNRLFRGKIDEISIYNRALTAGEIQAIFNAGSAGQCKPPSLALILSACCTYRIGDRFTVQAHITNPSRDVPVEAKAGVRFPDGTTTVNVLGNTHLEVTLPAGLDTTVTLIDILLPFGLPTGTWKFEGALLGPNLGETFSREVKPFAVVP